MNKIGLTTDRILVTARHGANSGEAGAMAKIFDLTETAMQAAPHTDVKAINFAQIPLLGSDSATKAEIHFPREKFEQIKSALATALGQRNPNGHHLQEVHHPETGRKAIHVIV